jgi:hypothetical protein
MVEFLEKKKALGRASAGNRAKNQQWVLFFQKYTYNRECMLMTL